MRFFILLAAFLLTATAWAQRDPDYFTGHVHDQANFIVLSSPNCQNVYYVPKTYQVNPLLSSILVNKKKMDNGETKPIITMTLVIEPDISTIPKDARDLAPYECQGIASQLAHYPDAFQELTVNSASVADAMSFRWIPMSGFQHILQIDVDPREISLPDLLDHLRFFSAEQLVHFFWEVTDAQVELTASYQAAADFTEKWWNDRICTIRTTAHKIAGFKFGSHSSESCEDIPRMAQIFKGAEYKSVFVFKSNPSPGFPESELSNMENELMSRLVRSLYMESSRIQLDNLIVITLGQLKKVAAGNFHDQIIRQRMVEDLFRSNIQVRNLDDFAKPVLTLLYRPFQTRKLGEAR